MGIREYMWYVGPNVGIKEARKNIDELCTEWYVHRKLIEQSTREKI